VPILPPYTKRPAHRTAQTGVYCSTPARALAPLLLVFAAVAGPAAAQDDGVVRNVHIQMDPASVAAPPSATGTPISSAPGQPPVLTRADISRLITSLKSGQNDGAVATAPVAPIIDASSQRATAATRSDPISQGLGPNETVVHTVMQQLVSAGDRTVLGNRGHFPAPPSAAVAQMPAENPAVLHVRHGVTADFEVSGAQPNMVATPFMKPKVVNKRVNGEDPSGSRVWGSDIFFSPKEETTVFIKDAGLPNSPVVALHLLPRKISGRSVTLVLDGAIPQGRGDPQSAGEESGYVEGITATMKQAVLGQVPDGYTEALLDAPMAISGPIKATPIGRYAGTDADIYRYRLLNTGTEPITLSEEAFGSDHVLAVTIFPNLAVRPGETTDVLIMFAKQVM
jgi:conjugal transfer pilus assembly protein TraK